MSEARRPMLGLDLTPVSRRPLVLCPETVAGILALPAIVGRRGDGRPHISIVVVTHHNEILTRLCLYSVLTASCNTTFELIVVDNGSSDGTIAFLQELADRNEIHLIRNPVNEGFAAANNQGIRLARGEVIVLLNNDTVVADGWLDRLRQRLKAREIGLIGPVTNRIGNEAEVDTQYRTVAELLAEASHRLANYAGQTFELPRPAMFCVAARKDVLEQIGELDEQFGQGFFEDDDYAVRVKRAGYQCRGAEDVLVHHFGEGTFGNYFADGTRQAVFNDNRMRFEKKWGVTWAPPQRRVTSRLTAAWQGARELAQHFTPMGSTIAVISRGDDDLIRSVASLGRRAIHFPADQAGGYAGFHPADSRQAIQQLSQAIAAGASHLLVPESSLWWLGAYPEFASRIAGVERGRTVHGLVCELVPGSEEVQ